MAGAVRARERLLREIPCILSRADDAERVHVRATHVTLHQDAKGVHVSRAHTAQEPLFGVLGHPSLITTRGPANYSRSADAERCLAQEQPRWSAGVSTATRELGGAPNAAMPDSDSACECSRLIGGVSGLNRHALP
jgi:hypothetical protein